MLTHRWHVFAIVAVAITGVFGMHENANISCALAETFATFATVLKMEAGGSSSGGAGTLDIFACE